MAILAGSNLFAQSADEVIPEKQLPFQILKGLDIGDVGEPGSTTINETTGEYTVSGSGGDIFGNRDQFHYAYLP